MDDEVEEIVVTDAQARNINDKPASASLLNLQLSNTAAAAFTLEAAGDPGDQATVTMTLSNQYGLRLFGFPNIVAYQDAISGDDSNMIPIGSNVTAADYTVYQWVDWGSTNNNNIVLKFFIKNLSASTKDVIFAGNWRFIVEQAET